MATGALTVVTHQNPTFDGGVAPHDFIDENLIKIFGSKDSEYGYRSVSLYSDSYRDAPVHIRIQGNNHTLTATLDKRACAILISYLKGKE